MYWLWKWDIYIHHPSIQCQCWDKTNGCFWCSVHAHLIKGECTPARVPATFPRNKVTIRKPVGVMHACYLFTPTDNWQCVYLRKLQLSKDSLCQFAGPLNAMKHKYALKAWNKTMIPIQLITPWTNAGACVSLFPAAANPSLLFPETRLSLHCCWET